MALLINLTDSKGQVCNYHKIIAVNQVYTGQQEGISINLASYTSQEYRARDNEEQHTIVANTGLFLPFNDSDDFSRTTLYARIKNEIEAFITSEDC